MRAFVGLIWAVLMFVCSVSFAAEFNVDGTVDVSAGYSGDAYGPIVPSPTILRVGDVVTYSYTFEDGKRLRLADQSDGRSSYARVTAWLGFTGSSCGQVTSCGDFTIDEWRLELIDPMSRSGAVPVSFSGGPQGKCCNHVGSEASFSLADGDFIEFSGVRTTFTITSLPSSPNSYNSVRTRFDANNITVVDPTMPRLTDDARIDGGNTAPSRANGNFGSRPDLLVHRYHPSRSLLKFDVDPLKGKYIDSARLELSLRSLNREGTLSISPLVSFWNEETVTWNIQPPAEPPSVTHPVTSADVGQVVSIDVTNIVRRWANDTLAPDGLMLESRDSIRALFAAKEAGASTAPKLVVTLGKSLKINIGIENIATGEQILNGATVPSGTPFRVQVKTSNVDCMGAYAVSAVGAPGNYPSVGVQTESYILGPAIESDDFTGPPLTAGVTAEGRNIFKVSATCNGAGPGEFASDTFEFFVEQ